MEKINNQGKAGITIILLILVLALLGYIGYDKFYSKKEVSTISTTTKTTTKVVTANDYYYTYNDICGNVTTCQKSLNDIKIGGKVYKASISYDSNAESNSIKVGDKTFNIMDLNYIAVMDNTYLVISNSLPSDLYVTKMYDKDLNEVDFIKTVTADSYMELKTTTPYINSNAITFALCTNNSSPIDSTKPQDFNLYELIFKNGKYEIKTLNTISQTICTSARF